jgi:hypothetical protein
LTHSVSAGLDYAAVGPEHAWLRDQGRVEYGYATDDQALAAFMKLARLEGIIPALESAHAIAAVMERAPKMSKGASSSSSISPAAATRTSRRFFFNLSLVTSSPTFFYSHLAVNLLPPLAAGG